MSNRQSQIANDHFVAHYRESDGVVQTVAEHCIETSILCNMYASKLDFSECGKLLGLIHDLGKYSELFQRYIRSSVGLLQPEECGYVNPASYKGKIDHSTSGAQWFISTMDDGSSISTCVHELICLCACSHHGGLMDCLSVDGEDKFSERLNKILDYARPDELYEVVDKHTKQELGKIKHDLLLKEVGNAIRNINENVSGKKLRKFWFALLTRYLLSCLIDADRINTSDFERGTEFEYRLNKKYIEWKVLVEVFEKHISAFKADSDINRKRSRISKSCLLRFSDKIGLYYLTVPTGGGKTLASLRFALHHAKYHKLDRIIYVIPYTSIIDQNADEVREIYASLDEDISNIVLEHHSNITEQKDTKRNRLLSENWDAPIVFTTSVQLLEAIFGGGTRGVRRMHALTNAVIIFDEVQTLPVKTVHLFNNAVNFLISIGKSTCVFCTATQPLLHQVDQKKGAVSYSTGMELVNNPSMFNDFRKIKVENRCKPGGWTVEELKDDVKKNVEKYGSMMFVANTKCDAMRVYEAVKNTAEHAFFLSAKMCSSHRMDVIRKLKSCLTRDENESVVCVSTQLIEAGVNVDFGCVYRTLAGIDSISQAAGRCNRENLRDKGLVIALNLAGERLGKLPEIFIAQEKAERVLRDFANSPVEFEENIISRKSVERYYQYYFYERANEMSYKLKKDKFGRDDNMLEVLSENTQSVAIQKSKLKSNRFYTQSFKSAGFCFEVIDAPSKAVIVNYKGFDGRCSRSEELTGELLQSGLDLEREREILRMLQSFTVNVFPWEMDKLLGQRDALIPVGEGRGIYILQDHYYSNENGLNLESISEMSTLMG